MRFFRRPAKAGLITCPHCCQLIAPDALTCDMCGADLRELPDEKRAAGGFKAQTLSGSGNPYSR